MRSRDRADTPVRDLKNIGPTIAARLAAVGVRTARDLEVIGPPEAYRRVRRRYATLSIPVCYYLYALQGALDGVHWDSLSAATKRSLREKAATMRPVRSLRGGARSRRGEPRHVQAT
jgi:DNA transformation protein and related proteins